MCQNLSTGEMVYESLGVFRSYVLGGANAGARIYFVSGVPSDLLGVDNDLVIDTQGKNFYFKESGAWVLKDNYGAPDTGIGVKRFTSVYGSDGLAADGLSYQDDDLIGGDVTDVRVEVTPLIAVEAWGTTPAFDEFDFDDTTGTVLFGDPLPAGMRITILYSF
ncbi:hypothetical protein [Chitinophaga cymbidii]|uniref:hypothetical protein n=1 Tax=Chitinophaga cymbidii TaxID=1096750 RepID=UPI0011BF40BC|nr:hypothetical protein [Chitinophaga cymbidii]